MTSAFDVAKYYLKLADDDSGELLSNMKLQKLLYYAQGFHVAILGTPLFNERILAWIHGPVVGKVYYEYKKYGNQGIPATDENVGLNIPEEALKIVDDVYYGFGQFSAWKLREMTHEEPPWANTQNGEEISLKDMEEYFKTRIVDE